MGSSNTYLVSKEDHDGVAASSTGCVLDCEGVVVIANDVKVNVGLSGAYHTRGTLDADADVTCSRRGKGGWDLTWVPHPHAHLRKAGPYPGQPPRSLR